MSRAFVRESDEGTQDDLPELPLSVHPNYVTPRGLALLQRRLHETVLQRDAVDGDAMGGRQERARLARDIRWLQARLAVAIPVPEAAASPAKAGFGVVVEFMDEEGQMYCYQIVGEDEADPEQGYLSWVSPLARALEGASQGDEIRWPRPSGDRVVEIVSIKSGRARVL